MKKLVLLIVVTLFYTLNSNAQENQKIGNPIIVLPTNSTIPKSQLIDITEYLNNFKTEYTRLYKQKSKKNNYKPNNKVVKLLKYDLDYLAKKNQLAQDMKIIASRSTSYNDLHANIVNYIKKKGNKLSNKDLEVLIKWDNMVRIILEEKGLLNSSQNKMMQGCISSIISTAGAGAYLGSLGGPWGVGIGAVVGAAVAIYEDC